MKKLVFLGSAITAFLTPVQALAANINIAPPTQGFRDIGDAISKILSIAFVVALLLVLIMLIWGAFEWIASGGDKEAVGKARGKILNALIGIAILAVAFALFRFAGQFVGFNIEDSGSINLSVPVPAKQP
ncbi:hypothetical protein HYU95_03640 [Candidatus Daviesbacteria bacterium]|nr:hypothetical protein [Candidatus Daviesbacteria bacterium]